MVLFGVLSAEQTFLTPEEAVGGVLIAAHIQQRRRHQSALSGDVADDLIMVDLPYDPDKLEQIEDRVHRASNMHKVTIWHLLSKHTIDEAIAEKAAKRHYTTRALLDGSRGIDFNRKVVAYATGDTETE